MLEPEQRKLQKKSRMHDSGLSNSAKPQLQTTARIRERPNLRNILPLHVRNERSLWICKVTIGADFCPHSHVLFNEPGVGLTWFACACYRTTQFHCSCPHIPLYRDILIPFFAWLVCQFMPAEGPWLNFPPRRMLGLSFVCSFASRMEVVPPRSLCAYVSICAHVWSEVCRLKPSVCVWKQRLPCEVKLWRE